MTALAAPERLWVMAAGWGIAADLIPPEVVAARRLKVLRRRIAIALTVLAVLVAVGYGLAVMENFTARDRTAAEQARTVPLQAEQRRYGDVTQTQAKLTLSRTQVAGLMASDVDVSAFLTRLDTPLPATMSITTLTVNLLQATVAAPAAAGAGGLDTSGRAPIGSVVVGGTATTFDDVAHYVDALAATPGVANVVPTSSQADETGVQYSLTFSLTDTLLSKRFDLTTKAATP